MHGQPMFTIEVRGLANTVIEADCHPSRGELTPHVDVVTVILEANGEQDAVIVNGFEDDVDDGDSHVCNCVHLAGE